MHPSVSKSSSLAYLHGGTEARHRSAPDRNRAPLRWRQSRRCRLPAPARRVDLGRPLVLRAIRPPRHRATNTSRQPCAPKRARLPPALILTAEVDPIRDDVEVYGARQRRDGVMSLSSAP
ncbi:alpha/beta hydrolase fold domain-containing protein [Rhodococcus wratislaviensis]|nr:alpha/beta hydrolase fold domain-containing protein [Rhodococcus sp. 3A]MBC2894645.1 alpha/beta hydrolase fold domain-containing protein [Rhodococcus sp. 4CII]